MTTHAPTLPPASAVGRAAPARRLPVPLAALVALLAVIAAAFAAPVARALPPGGPHENRAGATVAVRKIVPPVDATVGPKIVDPGIVSFTGKGFAAGEEVFVKIDDGRILPAAGPPGGGNAQDSMTVVTAGSDGTLTGHVDLADVAASGQAAVATGKHSLRFISAHPRSLHGDFIVSEAFGGGPSKPNDEINPDGALAAIGPPADQQVAWGGPYVDVPRLAVGSKLPFRVTGLPPNQVVNVKVDDGTEAMRPAAPRPNPLMPGETLQADVWDQFRTDEHGNASGFANVPTTGVHVGTHWLRFLGSGGSPRSLVLPYEITADAAGRNVDVAASAQRGRELTISGSGLLRDAFYRDGFRDGQGVTVRLDDGPLVTLEAGADGTLAGALPIPADTSLGVHRVTAWVGFQAGGDDPQAVIERDVEITEHVVPPTPDDPPLPPGPPSPPAPPKQPDPPSAPAVRWPALTGSARVKAAKGRSITLKLRRGSQRSRTTVTVRTAAKYRIGGARKARTVTVAGKRSVTLPAGSGSSALTLKLTAQGRKLLRQRGSLRVNVRVAPAGGKATTKRITIRR